MLKNQPYPLPPWQNNLTATDLNPPRSLNKNVTTPISFPLEYYYNDNCNHIVCVRYTVFNALNFFVNLIESKNVLFGYKTFMP